MGFRNFGSLLIIFSADDGILAHSVCAPLVQISPLPFVVFAKACRTMILSEDKEQGKKE